MSNLAPSSNKFDTSTTTKPPSYSPNAQATGSSNSAKEQDNNNNNIDTKSSCKDEITGSEELKRAAQAQPAAARQLSAGKSSTSGQQQTGTSSCPTSGPQMSINRQHLTARIKTVIAKLLECHGAELRRTLFSLRQIFQDDSELATAFIESDGLECLMKVAIDADQIHQNYILRALGQLIAYPSGMNGLTRHNETIKWLYTLLASQHRLVVKTSIKLLLSFVDYSDNNCLHFCRSIKAVDGSKGAIYWTNLIELFRQQPTLNSASSNNNKEQQLDIGLLVDAISLINKTLAGIPDQDTYYDFVDPLEELGIEKIIEKYSPLDARLREQFELYEQVLSTEDHEDEDEVVEEGSRNNNNINNNNNNNNQSSLINGATDKNNDSSSNNSLDKNNLAKVDSSKSMGSASPANSNIMLLSPSLEQDQGRRRSRRANISGSSSSDDSCSSSNNNIIIINNVNEADNNTINEGIEITTDDNYESANESNESQTSSHKLTKQSKQDNQTDHKPPPIITPKDGSVDDDDDADDDEEEEETREDHGRQSGGCQVNGGINNRIIGGNSINTTTTKVAQRQQLKQAASTETKTHDNQLQPTNNNNNGIKQEQQNQNLARGKLQQRASISSCSSSDSYASYGSGYASGSGNSTDHELKQKNSKLNNGSVATSRQTGCGGSSSNSNATGKDTDGKLIAERRRRLVPAAETATDKRAAEELDDERDNDDDEDVDVEDDEEEDEDDESQLKQHLSELEQMTDELARRNIFGVSVASTDLYSQSQQQSAPSNHHNFIPQSSIKSTGSSSSKSSSILSTGSGSISSNFSDTNKTNNSDRKLIAPREPSTQRNPSSVSPSATSQDGSARSASATPTSMDLLQQQKQPQNMDSLSKLVAAPVARSANQHPMAPPLVAKLNSGAGHIRPPPPTATASVSTLNGPSDGQPTSGPVATTASSAGPKQQQQEPYYHNLFQWEQLVSRGVTRPLLINDLDFTDLRDEDDCDLLANGGHKSAARNQVTGEPLTINIPGAQRLIRDHIDGRHLGQQQSSGGDSSLDSGTCADELEADNRSPVGKQRVVGTGDPASAPPPMPPPPISPWFNTMATSAGSRPQSQFMSSPSPPFEFPIQQSVQSRDQRDQSPANSTYSNYSRNSVCLPQQPAGDTLESARHQVEPIGYSTLQPLTGGGGLRSASSMSSLLFGGSSKYSNGRKKTMKLFWKEVREDRSLLSKLTKKRTIWDEIKPVQVDTQKLEYLFESKAKDLMLSKSRMGLDGAGQRKVKITVLDAKRSNAINIGMTKLPPMRTIKSAILKMDSSIMNREGIEKILTTMMPSEEEKSRIIEAQLANPDTPLGTAEQFLLNLASISALEARLKLWAFQLDYAQIEKEVAEPLMDLKQAIEEIERSETFRIVLGTLLAIGNFLNSTQVKGFQIDYLEKVPEVKDTVHKHSLLHHLCLFIQEKYDPQSTSDLYSEFSAVNRASKVDYTEVAKNLKKMQQDCKASWDYLKIVAKHDGLANLMNTTTSAASASSSSSSSGASAATGSGNQHQNQANHGPKSAGKLNNLSKLSMITTVMSPVDNISSTEGQKVTSGSTSTAAPTSKQLKTKVSDFLTDCAERIMVLMVIHRRVLNRFQKLLVYLGCPSHQIKQSQPQQILKIINEFALEYRTKRERVREMLLKKQQCSHYHPGNRWNRPRWAGSQQCIAGAADGYYSATRPCSTTSSCASSYAPNANCTDSLCCSLAHDRTGGANQHLISQHLSQQQQLALNRAGSPSSFSQTFGGCYSDYLFSDQLCCGGGSSSRQQSVTPVPMATGGDKQQRASSHIARRPHSMSISMYNLQNSQTNAGSAMEAHEQEVEERAQEQVQKDEQLRRVLNAGKSLDGACQELYQMSHWSSTMARVTRHPPLINSPAASHLLAKQRSASIDCPQSDGKSSGGCDGATTTALDQRRQSSYYRYLRNGQYVSLDDDEHEQNSDDEIMQSLVRTATAKGAHHQASSSSTGHSSAAKNKILSRFSCDRKSLRRDMRTGIELSNVG